MSVAKFDRFEDLEDHVVDYLASVTDLKVFGCTVDFLQADTQTYLENPMWEKLQQNTEYTIVFRSCCAVLHSKEIFEGCPFRDLPLAVIRLPYTLHTIRVKAFMNCAALPELAIPPSLHYIASRAFLDCAALRRLVKLPGRHKWRGTYAEENAFAICAGMRWPPWLHMIPDIGYVSGLA